MKLFNVGDLVVVRQDVGVSHLGILMYDNSELAPNLTIDFLHNNEHYVINCQSLLLVLEQDFSNEYGEHSTRVLYFTKTGWVPSIYLKKL